MWQRESMSIALSQADDLELPHLPLRLAVIPRPDRHQFFPVYGCTNTGCSDTGHLGLPVYRSPKLCPSDISVLNLAICWGFSERKLLCSSQ